MSARGLLLAFVVAGGCGEIREVPVDAGGDTTSGAAQTGTDESTTLTPTDDGDEGSTTEDPPDVDTDTTTAGTDTGGEPSVAWQSFCVEDAFAENPGDEVVIEIPVEEVELRSGFRIGMRVQEAQAGLRATVTFGGQEVLLIDAPECGADMTASFTDAGMFDNAKACDPDPLDEEQTIVPLEPLAPLLDGEIAGTWRLAFSSEAATDATLVVAQTCVFVATPD